MGKKCIYVDVYIHSQHCDITHSNLMFDVQVPGDPSIFLPFNITLFKGALTQQSSTEKYLYHHNSSRSIQIVVVIQIIFSAWSSVSPCITMYQVSAFRVFFVGRLDAIICQGDPFADHVLPGRSWRPKPRVKCGLPYVTPCKCFIQSMRIKKDPKIEVR